MKGNDCHKMNSIALGLSFGVVWALSVLFIGIVAAYTGYGFGFVEGVGSVYIGYKATIVGSLIGALWGFVDFFLFGFFIALFYNWFSCCCKCPFSKKK